VTEFATMSQPVTKLTRCAVDAPNPYVSPLLPPDPRWAPLIAPKNVADVTQRGYAVPAFPAVLIF
jgi:hypothetical protein